MSQLELKNVFIVDDDAAVRDALGLLLLSHGYSVRTFESGERFLAALEPTWEGVAVLDIRMEGMSGQDVFDALRQRGSELLIIFLSGHGDIPMAVQAVKDGAFDFLEKPCTDHLLLSKLNAALDICLTRKQSRGNQEAVHSRLGKLSPREREVMERVLAGKLNKVIADELDITMRTVEVHRANVFAKMGVRSAVELAQLLAGKE
ncbi:two-component system response regulator DctR [Chitinivorax tropicus]|uniref:Two-component system response regulator DctR n=1 Tax=Chitinivorax tropicus TaxID=714531 RepID=A0A840MKW8_9PROT|nr:response regulator [Chitinivorax tropicus]MBB5016783.1 two-component system response regulator DctR [Chitinivorax tropicus]